MKALTHSSAARILTISAVIAGLAYQADAQIITLNNNNSTVQIDTASQSGMFNWLVDGRDQLAQQWFWFRAGAMTNEHSINTISAPTITTPDSRTLVSSYGNGSYGISVTYRLTGQSFGSGLSSVSESIVITNFSAAPLDFHFFQYSDFDIEGGPNSVALGKDIFGKFNEALVSSGPNILSETVATPGANHGEAALFPFTLNRLNDGLPTTLNDVATAGPGDVTWGLEWDFTLNGFGTFGISKEKDLQIPEPATGAILLVGFAGMAVRRRFKTAK